MTSTELEQILEQGENLKVEFKTRIHAKDMRERIALAVDELVAFANAKGGTVYMGIEDDGEVTGCTGYDVQKIMESIYDRTRPALFTDIEVIPYSGKDVLAITVERDGTTYATSDGRCLKRLGKNSKPYYPDEMSNIYATIQSPDFSGQILADSTAEDINALEIYNLKEKLKIRDPKSSLSELEDMSFLRDLGLVREDEGVDKLTIAGLLFVGKETAINRLLPQAEVIYLHYSADNMEEYDSRLDLKQPIISVIDRLTEKIQNANKIVNVQVGLFRLEVEDFSEKVFQEALLNALSHRDYMNMGAVYVKHYPDRIVIENPGAFPEGVNEKNIITHPSTPRNKLIAETLQRLKYVQRTGQGVDIIFREMISSGKPYPQYHAYNEAVTLTIFSAIDDVNFVRFIASEQDKLQKMIPLPELMILRYLTDNKRIILSEVQELTQLPIAEARKNCNDLAKNGLIELSGKEYMLTPKVYEAIKSDVEYTQDKTIQFIKAKSRILDYLEQENSITNEKIRELCGFTKQQARAVTDKMRAENMLRMEGKGRLSRYVKADD
ncbi:MAG: putative DNA binding domain-containing protein [Lachnoclostridium sp.]|nr:putative DNA binding domain-containing protein [Lachnoclostridium sp.]MCM1383375.1 putative DNA binding domain-containing protein [Lachnoclostridium sp.]